MRWVEFDVSAAHALAYQCTVASDVLRAQGWGRRNSVEVALEDFHGAYALLFADACRLESEDRVGLARALDEVAEQVRDVIAAAQREEARLEQAHQDSLRQEEEGVFNRWADQWAPFADLPYSPPQIEAVFSPRIRSRVVGRHNGGGKVGARPEALRAFVEHARGANTALERELRQVGLAWNVFTYRCPWAQVGTLTLLNGADHLVAENRLDEQWVSRLANAFETAGSSGALLEVELSAAAASLDPTYAHRLLADETLTPQQLTLVAARLCADPALASIVAEHTNGVLKGLTLKSESIQLLRATALLEGLSTNGPASAALLRGLKAEGLIDRVGLAGGYAHMGRGGEALPYAQALREVFRKGEPHLASIDPALSSAYATSMISFVNGARFDGAVPGNDILALSYLLHGSTLSTPFLAVVGKELEKTEKRFIQSDHSWARATTHSKGMASLFPTEKAQAAFDPVTSYMSALGNNPAAAHAFFTGGGEERVQYWVEKRRWGHDNFDGLLAALDAAITQGDNAGQPSSARLASSTIEYLANRTQGMDSAGNPLLFHNDDEKILPGTVGKTGINKLVHILGTHMLSVEEAIRYGDDYKSAIGASETIGRDDYGSMTNIPRFNRPDLLTLMKPVVSSDEGLRALRQAVTNYQDLHFAVVLRDHYGKLSYDQALKHALGTDAKLEGFFIDQIAEARIDAMKTKADLAQYWIDLGKDISGNLPFSDIPVAGNFAGFLADRSLSELERSVLGNIEHEESAERLTAELLAQDALRARKGAIVGALNEAGIIDHDLVVQFCTDTDMPTRDAHAWLQSDFPSVDVTEQDIPDERMRSSEEVRRQKIIDRIAGRYFDLHDYTQDYETAFEGFFK